MKVNESLEGVHVELREIPKAKYGIACDECAFKCNNYLCQMFNDKCSNNTAFVLVAD